MMALPMMTPTPIQTRFSARSMLVRQPPTNFQLVTQALSLDDFPVHYAPATFGVVFRMNKQDLIAVIAETSGLTTADAGKAVDAVFDAIANALKNGDSVKVLGFGSFSVGQRAASEGRNPRTGEKIKIAASKQPKFSAGQGLKDAVNQ